jgi:hypothetical protein
MAEPRYCRECTVEIGPRNTSGYCVRHLARRNAADPEWREKQLAGIRRKFRSDPEYVEKVRANVRKAEASRDRGAMRERWFRDRVWEKSNPAHPPGSPSRLKAAQSISATKLADIPPHLREMYRDITRSGMRAAEARALVMDHHDAEMRRWRRGTAVADG